MTPLFNFLLVIQGIVAATLVGLVLMQRSEGGGLGIGGGGSPGGVMSARGAANFLSRATKWSAILFVVLAIVLAGIATNQAGSGDIQSTLDRSTAASDAEGAAAPDGPAEDGPAEDAPSQEAPADNDPLGDVFE